MLIKCKFLCTTSETYSAFPLLLIQSHDAQYHNKLIITLQHRADREGPTGPVDADRMTAI